MNRYENGMIYMIESPSAGLCYYGSTCMPLAKRLYNHRKDYERYRNGTYHFVTSFKVLDYDDHKIILVEEVKCESKQQLIAREAYYIRNHECVNKYIPDRTKKEYEADNKEKIKERMKQYREHNKEELQKKINCECGNGYTRSNKARHERSVGHQAFVNNQQ